jgi:hypothetical protein
LYSSSSEWIFPKHFQYPLEIDIGTKLVPYLENSEYYIFLPYKIVEKKLQEGSIIEIPMMEASLPFMRSYVIYKIDNKKSNMIDAWLKA